MSVVRPIHAALKVAVLALLLANCNDSSFDCNGKLKGANPLNIRNCILGTWTMTGSSGGLSGQGMGDVSDRQIKFTITDSIYYIVHGQIQIAGKITWVYEKDIVNEQNYLMDFGSTRWGVDGIFAGELVIYENVSDGFTYYLKKQ